MREKKFLKVSFSLMRTSEVASGKYSPLGTELVSEHALETDLDITECPQGSKGIGSVKAKSSNC